MPVKEQSHSKFDSLAAKLEDRLYLPVIQERPALIDLSLSAPRVTTRLQAAQLLAKR